MRKPFAGVVLASMIVTSVLAKNPLFYGADPSGRGWPDGRMWIYPTTDKAYEAAYVFKRVGVYYYTIADRFNHLIYYTGGSPTGPFTYRGEYVNFNEDGTIRKIQITDLELRDKTHGASKILLR